MPMMAMISIDFRVKGDDDELMMVKLKPGLFSAGTRLGKIEMALIIMSPVMERQDAVKAPVSLFLLR